MGDPGVIRRGGCLTAVLLAAAIGGGASQAPDAILDLLEGPDARTVRVLRVIDGDTLAVTSTAGAQHVRLLGVDTPAASRARYRHPGCGGRLATAATRSWVARKGALVRLASDRLAPDRDRHGRLLAHVRTPGGGDLAVWLVSRGLARTVSYEKRPLAAHPRLLALEAKARGRREGLWSKCPRWAREHAIPFTSVPDGHRALHAAEHPPVAIPMVAPLATGGAVR